MARKKNAKSLFEVISRDAAKSAEGGKQSLGVPGWFGRGGQAPPAAPEPPPLPATARQPAEPPPAEAGEPIVSVAGGRLRISLNQVSAAVLVLGLILLLVGVFLLGRRTASSAPAAPQPAPPPAGREAPGERQTGGIPPLPHPPLTAQSPEDEAEATSTGPARQKGHWYLVIQVGILNKAQAEAIQDYLKNKGVQTTVYRSRFYSHKWTVKDLRGFTSGDSPEVTAYKKWIEKLGQEYADKGGLYDFKGCYPSPES